MVHVIAFAESGNSHEPDAATRQPSPASPPGPPTTAAAPSANRAFATMRLGLYG
jgi:hypothetical protein